MRLVVDDDMDGIDQAHRILELTSMSREREESRRSEPTTIESGGISFKSDHQIDFLKRGTLRPNGRPSLLGSGLILVASALRCFPTTTTFDDGFRVPRFKIQ